MAERRSGSKISRWISIRSPPSAPWPAPAASSSWTTRATWSDAQQHQRILRARDRCGQCTPCREGSLWMKKITDRLLEGGGVGARPSRFEKRRRQHRGQNHLRIWRSLRVADAEFRREVQRRVRRQVQQATPTADAARVFARGTRSSTHRASRLSPARTPPVCQTSKSPPPEAPPFSRMSTETAAPVQMVNVQIDGVWMQFPKGTRVIEACNQAQKFIPRYCYHPKLSSPGNCRMCLIEMGMPKMGPDRKPVIGRRWQSRNRLDPAPANLLRTGCSRRHGHPHRLADGARVPPGRDGVSPHQPPARLPDLRPGWRVPPAGIFSVEYGNGSSRFLEHKVKKPKNVELGPRVTLDAERCILCSRCIRFMKEVAHDDVLGFVDRGSHSHHRLSPRQKTREQLLAQHRGHLPSRRADFQRLPVQNARLVFKGNQELLHKLRDWVQHRDRLA